MPFTMRLLFGLGVCLYVGCAQPRDAPTPPDDGSHAPADVPADAPSDAAGEDAAAAYDPQASVDLDFSADVGGPSGGAVAQPERRPSGTFDVCGDKCDYANDLGLDLGDGEPVPDVKPSRKARRAQRRKRRKAQ